MPSGRNTADLITVAYSVVTVVGVGLDRNTVQTSHSLTLGCRYMVTPDPEKHVTGSLGLTLTLTL